MKIHGKIPDYGKFQVAYRFNNGDIVTYKGTHMDMNMFNAFEKIGITEEEFFKLFSKNELVGGFIDSDGEFSKRADQIIDKWHKKKTNLIKEDKQNISIYDIEFKNPDSGRKIKIRSALSYPENSKVYKIAQRRLKKFKEKNIDTIEIKPKKEPSVFIKKYGKYKLNAFPPPEVNESDVKVNLDGDIHSHAVLTWRDPKSGRNVNSYTQKFMKRNASLKWDRVKKLSNEKVDKIRNNSLKMLSSKNVLESDSAAIIALISMTGLRVGEHTNYERTKNRGVMTLGPDNVKVEGKKIILNFVGKSYKENNAEIENEQLANYIEKKIEKNKDKDFIFETNYITLNETFDKFAGKKFKIKDLRTYTATKIASEILLNDKEPPPPLPESDSAIKKVVKLKLKRIFEIVSQKLNNTPAMAKSSYIHPEVIHKWLDDIGVKPELKKEIYNENFNLQNVLTEGFKVTADFEDCDEYPLPEWWFNDNYEFKRIKKNITENIFRNAPKDTLRFDDWSPFIEKFKTIYALADSEKELIELMELDYNIYLKITKNSLDNWIDSTSKSLFTFIENIYKKIPKKGDFIFKTSKEQSRFLVVASKGMTHTNIFGSTNHTPGLNLLRIYKNLKTSNYVLLNAKDINIVNDILRYIWLYTFWHKSKNKKLKLPKVLYRGIRLNNVLDVEYLKDKIVDKNLLQRIEIIKSEILNGKIYRLMSRHKFLSFTPSLNIAEYFAHKNEGFVIRVNTDKVEVITSHKSDKNLNFFNNLSNKNEKEYIVKIPSNYKFTEEDIIINDLDYLMYHNDPDAISKFDHNVYKASYKMNGIKINAQAFWTSNTKISLKFEPITEDQYYYMSRIEFKKIYGFDPLPNEKTKHLVKNLKFYYNKNQYSQNWEEFKKYFDERNKK